MRNKNKIKFINDNNFCYISALSGTGKTTLLRDFCEQNLNKKITYLCFNNEMSKNSRELFPSNVSVYTFHSLAFKKVGYKYTKKITNNLSYFHIINSLMLFNSKDRYKIAEIIIKEIDNFCNSQYYNFSDMFYINEEKYSFVNLKTKKLIFYLNFIWKKMIDSSDFFPITQNIYLKIYQLSNGGFPEIDCDILVVDEIQDASHVVKDIILKQNDFYKKKIVLVGDKNQYIYSFMGSIDIYEELDKIKKAKNLNLNKTYRFGEDIANLANRVLTIKGEKNLLKGNEKINSRVGYIDYNKGYSIISRTNYSVIANLIRESKNNKNIYVYSKIDVYLKRMIDVINLKNDNKEKIINPEIKKWKSYYSFFKHYENDIEYSSLIRFVENYKGNIYEDINFAKSKIVKDVNLANVFLSTLHSVKGLEFDQVFLSGDFYSPYKKNKEIKENLNIEELNILYTAITRAKYNIKINKNVLLFE